MIAVTGVERGLRLPFQAYSGGHARRRRPLRSRRLIRILSDDHNSMVSKFEAAMAKMTVLGHNPRALIDCSDVIPVPPKAKSNTGFIPAGKTAKDIEASCKTARFPTLPVHPGPETSIAPV